MSFKKEIQAGIAKITIQESAGTASVAISIDQSLGGGEAAGVLKGSAEMRVELEADQLVDLGFELAEQKFPMIAPFLEAARVAIQLELKKA